MFGTLDPTLLVNDLYDLRLSAADATGRLSTSTAVVQVSGGMKIGPLRFPLGDLRLPLAGLPITINRTYDSRDLSVGDCGAGWRLDLQTLRLRTGRPLGTDWRDRPARPRDDFHLRCQREADESNHDAQRRPQRARHDHHAERL